MTSADSIEFVNRTEELDTLRARIPPRTEKSTLTFLRAPSGYGKSRLTSRLVESGSTSGPTFIIVDPAIRTKGLSDRVYAWFFVQRAADPEALVTNSNRQEFRTFTDYMRRAQFGRVNWKHVYENLKEAASISKLVRFIIELGENLIKRGRYSPDTLLQDDGRFATLLAQEYVLALARFRPTVFVVRECQNIDRESLQFFLTIGERAPGTCVLFEYTSSDGKFLPWHEKAIFESVAVTATLAVYDLLRLDLKEFRFLLRRYTSVDKTLEAAVELSWDGNLRLIKELNYRVMVGRSVDTASLPVLAETLRDNLAHLTNRARLILAIVTVHTEAISNDVLRTVARRINPALTQQAIKDELASLTSVQRYLTTQSGSYHLADEDLSDAIRSASTMTAPLRMAETSLRDLYLEAVGDSASTNVPLHAALRQAIALCARTGDVVAMRRLVRVFSSATGQAHDQMLYINMVAEAILSNGNLYELERRELIDWAAAAAYEVGDFSVATSLLELLEEPSQFDLAMLACCYGEVNRHEDAMAVADQLVTGSDPPGNVLLVADLVKLTGFFALGRRDEARALYLKIIEDKALQWLELFGFVQRYSEIVFDFPICTSRVLESIISFQRLGFRKSAAYSQLAAAMHLAYENRLDTARQLISSADNELRGHVRDRVIVLNNSVVVSLLSQECDFGECAQTLNDALFSARDSFYRFVLQSNLLICYWQLGDHLRARHCAEIMDASIAAPTFGNRDVFLTACYNVWQFFLEIGEFERAEHFRAIPLTLDIDSMCYPTYWRRRFGFVDTAAPEFDFLLKFKYHPEYLSHWVIDLEGLDLLKAKSAP